MMFAVDPAQAAGELHRVLRPAGRVAVAVWAAESLLTNVILSPTLALMSAGAKAKFAISTVVPAVLSAGAAAAVSVAVAAGLAP